MPKLLFLLFAFFISDKINAAFCAAPGTDGSPTISGVVNNYYEPTSSVSSGATNISLNSTAGLASGDLVLVIQNQDASINSSNSISYGDGASGRGFSAVNSTGLYEFASVASVAGSAITLNDGLVNSYNLSAATLSAGQKTYQVIRVPQYQDVTFSGTLTASAWDGATGGVFVVDVVDTVTGGGATIDLEGLGFRGGAYRATGVATNATQRQDYVANDATNTAASSRIRHASKGEGIAGSPQFVFNGTSVIDTNGASTADGYPAGDYARGAPGNAGGGGNEWNNGNDSAGGGGGNFGQGGQGGAGWNQDPVSQNVGGLGGGSFPATQARVVFGGGGGAGLANNANSPHGGNGGGIAIIRSNIVSGSFTINIDGADGTTSPSNDGAGGAGAAGSAVIIATSGLAGITVSAVGGDGGDAWAGNSGANAMHGPGGGGAGGYVIYSSGAGTPNVSVASGNNGTTTTRGETFGSTPGTAGSDTSENILYPCAADLSVAKDDSSLNYTPGQSSTYQISISNSGPANIASAVISDLIPDGFTIGSVSCSVASACTSISVTGQQVDVVLDINNGQTVIINVPVTAATDPTSY
ncbi:DUF11 domain-containing protein [Kangiella sp. HZ709]|uniref:DUF11 domain-containing protein n=1 Tax=Kangiella sp. HZ709 TaxID=2666328 RepID=UPI0012B0A9CE|nr:DUF11 domain-containing protein [Kangiella sp. HZ709]MRX28608.1 DUF11 domain-containing protein [Kangiella sp. HZ709]